MISSPSDMGHSTWFFWYVALGAAIAFVTVVSLRETKGSVLRRVRRRTCWPS